MEREYKIAIDKLRESYEERIRQQTQKIVKLETILSTQDNYHLNSPYNF